MGSMTSDELRALAEALRPMAAAPCFDGIDIDRAADFLLACADEQPVMQFVESQGAYTFEFLRTLTIKPGDMFYLHPAPAAPQAEPQREPLSDANNVREDRSHYTPKQRVEWLRAYRQATGEGLRRAMDAFNYGEPLPRGSDER